MLLVSVLIMIYNNRNSSRNSKWKLNFRTEFHSPPNHSSISSLMSDPSSPSAAPTSPIPSSPVSPSLISSHRKRRIIDHDEGEEEDFSLPTSSVVPSLRSSETRIAAADESKSINLEVLRVYYDRLFPVSLLIHWMRPAGASDAEAVKLREFSFTLVDDIYVRYLSFSNRDELKSALTSRVPIKIDLGACYNAPPSQRTAVSSFQPVQKELVFDIDMTDYDDVRKCCNAANICSRCWPLMSAAIRVINMILRENFGFQHLLWVYSGRRGVHCFVADERARKLSNELRTAVVEFLTVYLGKDSGKDGRKLNLSFPLHATLQKSYEILLPYFKNYIEAQGLFEDEQSLNTLLDFFDPALRSEFLFSDSGPETPGLERWEQLTKKVNQFLNKGNLKKYPIVAVQSVRTVLHRIVFSHVYPRLDVNVSKQLNHLLKSPFCIHPKTGRVCVPIDPRDPDQFDPFSVPTLSQLERELNAYQVDEAHPASAAWTQTSLKPALELFKDFVQKLVEAERRKLKYEDQSKKNSSLDNETMVKTEVNEPTAIPAW
jgi:DNA primase small subunit